jgi:hypothetical protein
MLGVFLSDLFGFSKMEHTGGNFFSSINLNPYYCLSEFDTA